MDLNLENLLLKKLLEKEKTENNKLNKEIIKQREKEKTMIRKFEALEGKIESLLFQNERLSRVLHIDYEKMQRILSLDSEKLIENEQKMIELEKKCLILLEKNQELENINTILNTKK